jgi:predicted ATPase/class 3 adenylate cyclase
MADLPTGTVTFLFTDVEGSTRLLHELGDAYADALGEHRRALRECFGRHGGVEVDTQGDAFFVAFAKASDALAAAVDGKAALEPGAIRVRMGLHTGEPLLTEEGYVGIDVHRAARIAAAGHGGQILVSQSTRDLIGADGLRDLGEHRLQDLAASERIYQLGDARFPPLRSLNATNLPLPAEPLVGRKKELLEVLRLIRTEGARLVTVTGPGGVGKTRFALEVGAELVADFTHGIWFVNVAAVRDPGLVLPTIAGRLGAKAELTEHIGDRAMLVLVDNFEQVVTAASDLSVLMSSCPNLVLLVTSRERLQVGGERNYPLRPLAESPAVELFRQRATATNPAFEARYEDVAALCDRVDGLPLAIELAAARVTVLSVAAIEERLVGRLDLLKTGRRDLPERQRTLRATMQWSHALLRRPEQQLFRRLGVFAGGFTLDASEFVAGATLESLTSLVDKSLVVIDDERFGLLEVLRQYAAELLTDSSEAKRMRLRHAQYFLELAKRDLPRPEWTSMMRLEHENILAALDALHDLGRADLELELAVRASAFWHAAGYVSQGRIRLEGALERAPLSSPRIRASGLQQAASLAQDAGDYVVSERHAREHLKLTEKVGKPRSGPFASLGIAAEERGDFDEAESFHAAALAIARQTESEIGAAVALNNLGNVALARGRLAKASAFFRESLSLARDFRDPEGTTIGLNNLALVELESGNDGAALELYRESFATAEAGGFKPGIVWTAIGTAAIRVKDDAPAAVRLLGAADAALGESGTALGHAERRLQMRAIQRARLELSDASFQAAFAEGSQVGVDALLSEALRALD